MITSQRTIFNHYNDPTLYHYEGDVIKMLLEDDDFFERNIRIINPNSFNHQSYREYVGLLKDAYLQDGLHLDAEMLRMRIERKSQNPLDLEEFDGWMEEFRKRELPEMRKKLVDNEFTYHNLWSALIITFNHMKDRYSDHMTSMTQLKNAANTLIRDADAVRKYLEDLNDESQKSGNEW